MTNKALTSPAIAALSDWRKAMAASGHFAAHTQTAYVIDTEQFLTFITDHGGGNPSLADLQAITIADLRALLSHWRRSGLGAASCARKLSSVRAFYRYLEDSGVAPPPALALIQTPKLPKRTPRPVDEAASAALTALAREGSKKQAPWIGARDCAALMLLYGAGLRISESLALTPADVDGDMLRIVGKGNKTRLVPLLPAVAAAIDAYRTLCPHVLGENDKLLRSVRGRPLGATAVQTLVRQLRGALGLPDSVTPHALRHSFASHLLSHGADLRVIQDLLGHANLSTTQIYTKVETQQLVDTIQHFHPRG
ncbi:MAG: tyrosine recombinase XerC [Pseudomonadota bacterium]